MNKASRVYEWFVYAPVISVLFGYLAVRLCSTHPAHCLYFGILMSVITVSVCFSKGIKNGITSSVFSLSGFIALLIYFANDFRSLFDEQNNAWGMALWAFAFVWAGVGSIYLKRINRKSALDTGVHTDL